MEKRSWHTKKQWVDWGLATGTSLALFPLQILAVRGCMAVMRKGQRWYHISLQGGQKLNRFVLALIIHIFNQPTTPSPNFWKNPEPSPTHLHPAPDPWGMLGHHHKSPRFVPNWDHDRTGIWNLRCADRNGKSHHKRHHSHAPAIRKG